MKNFGVLFLSIIGHIIISLLIILNLFVGQEVFIGVFTISLAVFISIFILKEKYYIDNEKRKSQTLFLLFAYIILLFEFVFCFFLDVFNNSLYISKYSLSVLSFSLLIRIVLVNVKKWNITGHATT